MMFAQDIPQEAETTGNVCPAFSLLHAYIQYIQTVHTAWHMHTVCTICVNLDSNIKTILKCRLYMIPIYMVMGILETIHL